MNENVSAVVNTSSEAQQGEAKLHSDRLEKVLAHCEAFYKENPNDDERIYNLLAPAFKQERTWEEWLENQEALDDICLRAMTPKDILEYMARGDTYDMNPVVAKYQGKDEYLAKGKAEVLRMVRRVSDGDLELTHEVLEGAIKFIRKQLVLYQLHNVGCGLMGGRNDAVQDSQAEANLIRTQLANLEATQKSLVLAEGAPETLDFFEQKQAAEV